MYYHECPRCGACLDPGESCTCEEDRAKVPRFLRIRDEDIVGCDLDRQQLSLWEMWPGMEG